MVHCQSRNAGRVVEALRGSGDAQTSFSRPSHFLKPSCKSHLVELSQYLSYIVVLADGVFSTLRGVKEVDLPCEVKILQKGGFSFNTSDNLSRI